MQCEDSWYSPESRLWSLYDVLRYFAGSFVTLMRDLQMAAFVASEQIDFGKGGAALMPLHREQCAVAVHNVGVIVDSLPLRKIVKIRIKEVHRWLSEDQSITYDRAALRLKDLHDTIASDLSSGAYFLMLTPDEATLYEQPEGPPFGSDVHKRFPQARYDIDHAAKCIALGESTAAVFHSMRAAELALQLLARRMGITYPEWSDWGKLLTDMDGKLKKMVQIQDKTPAVKKRMAYFAQARADLAAFNEAWRKHVAHPRESYDPYQAMSIFTHVKSLMQQLARDLPR